MIKNSNYSYNIKYIINIAYKKLIRMIKQRKNEYEKLWDMKYFEKHQRSENEMKYLCEWNMHQKKPSLNKILSKNMKYEQV